MAEHTNNGKVSIELLITEERRRLLSRFVDMTTMDVDVTRRE